jgi:hypothetical protein
MKKIILSICFISVSMFGQVGIGTTNPQYTLDLAAGTFGFGSANVRTETRHDAGISGANGAQSGFFETSAPTNYPAGSSSWWHLIEARHSNNSNNYALQIAGSFYDQDLWFRKTNGSGTTAWTQLLVANSAWKVLGNSGTNPTNNFLGTTDNQDLVFKTNNTEKARITAAGNIGIGTNAPGQKLDVQGGNARASGEVISTMITGYGQFRAINGNYGSFIRNDGADTYMPLLTNSGDQYGAWNGFRPIRINNATGDLYFNNSRNYFRESDGFVGIGNTNPVTKLDLRGTKAHNAGGGTGAANDDPSQAVIPAGSDGSSYVNDWPNGWGGGLATYDIVGASTFMNNYFTRSDKRLKNTIKPMDATITSNFMKLRPVTYMLNKQTPETEGLQYGFIAQEVAELFPSIVTKDSGAPDAIIGMNYQALIAPTVQMVQEQQKQIMELQKIIIDLQQQINSLKK